MKLEFAIFDLAVLTVDIRFSINFLLAKRKHVITEEDTCCLQLLPLSSVENLNLSKKKPHQNLQHTVFGQYYYKRCRMRFIDHTP